MKTALRIFGIFVATLLFLSIEIGDKPIFGHIYKLISPATKGAQKVAENFFNSSADQTQHYSKKLFENSAPKMGDSVRSKMSGIKMFLIFRYLVLRCSLEKLYIFNGKACLLPFYVTLGGQI
jgi:hypothetical protein